MGISTSVYLPEDIRRRLDALPGDRSAHITAALTTYLDSAGVKQVGEQFDPEKFLKDLGVVKIELKREY